MAEDVWEPSNASAALWAPAWQEQCFTNVWVSESWIPFSSRRRLSSEPPDPLFKNWFLFLFSSQERLLLCFQRSNAGSAWLSFMGHWAGRALQHWDVTAGWELQQPGGRASGQDQAKLPTWQETPLPTCSGTPGNVLPSGTKQQEQQVWLWHVTAVEFEVYTAFVFSQQKPPLMHIQSLYTKVCFSGKKTKNKKTGKNPFVLRSPKGKLLFV